MQVSAASNLILSVHKATRGRMRTPNASANVNSSARSALECGASRRHLRNWRMRRCAQSVSQRLLNPHMLKPRRCAPSPKIRLEQIKPHKGVGRKFILIWLCLFAPLSLNEEMKTSATAITNTSRVVPTMLSLLCAALLALSLSGCADTYSYSAPEARYNTYHAPYYYPYYPWYSYYGGAYYYGD
jgi:hypothetical protein